MWQYNQYNEIYKILYINIAIDADNCILHEIQLSRRFIFEMFAIPHVPTLSEGTL